MENIENRVARPPPTEELAKHVAFFVVLLRDRPDRVAKVDVMRQMVPSLQVIDAIDGGKLTIEELGRLVESGMLKPGPDGKHVDEYVDGRVMTVGNLGAYLSHRLAMQRVAALGRDVGGPRYGVVLEDDVVLRPGFLEAVALMVHAFDSMGLEGAVVPDIVNMYVFESQRRFFKQFADQERVSGQGQVPSAALVPTPVGLWGLQCYMLPPPGAAKALQLMWPMRGAVDEQITRVGLNSLTLVGVTVVDGEVVKSYTNTTRTIDEALADRPTRRIL